MIAGAEERYQVKLGINTYPKWLVSTRNDEDVTY